MKYEWRKHDKSLYLPKHIEIKTLESMRYIVISGQGNPNSELFKKHIEVLYNLSYGIKMAPKKNIEILDYFDYTVFPLQGKWSLTQEGINQYNSGVSIIDLKDEFSYDLMIRQPKFVSKELFELIQSNVYKKKNNPLLLDARFVITNPVTICQSMHIGSYDNEPITFKLMENYINDHGYLRKSKDHTEIYISDARKTAVEKLKTTLQFVIEKK